MKKIKSTFVAALGLLTVIVLIGPSSAAAESTALCSFQPGIEDIIYLGGGVFDVIYLEEACDEIDLTTQIHENTENPAILLTSAGNVTCNVLFSSTSVGTLGTPQVINGNFTYSNCLRNGSESCTVTEQNGPSEVKVLKEGHETAGVSIEGEMKVKCGSFINCTFSDNGLKGSAKGPLLSSKTFGETVVNKKALFWVSGFFCPTATLDITIIPLVATYIAL